MESPNCGSPAPKEYDVGDLAPVNTMDFNDANENQQEVPNGNERCSGGQLPSDAETASYSKLNEYLVWLFAVKVAELARVPSLCAVAHLIERFFFVLSWRQRRARTRTPRLSAFWRADSRSAMCLMYKPSQ